MPVHGPSVPDVTTHCDTCGCPEEESCPFLRDTRPIPLLHQTQQHFSSSHFLLWDFLFSFFILSKSNAEEMPKTSCLESDSRWH